MNRWLKYGGIMPETVNINDLEYIENYYLNTVGSPTANNSFKYSIGLKLQPGKYAVKFFTNRSFARSRFRVVQYDLEGVFRSYDEFYPDSASGPDMVYKLEIIVPTASIIGFSINKGAVVMEIEKL